MDSKSQFYALEVMCRERAAVARKDLEYWLAEAEEWAQLSLELIEKILFPSELAPDFSN